MTITTVKLDTIWHWQNISTLLSNIKLLDVNEISLSAVPCIFQAVWNYNKYNDSLKFGGRKKFNKIENKSETMFIILSWKCKGYFEILFPSNYFAGKIIKIIKCYEYEIFVR